MNPEHIASMAVKSCTNYEVAPRDFVAANMERVAFALAHIKDPGVSLFGMAKYCDSKHGLDQVERDLWMKVLGDYPDWPKRAHKPESVRRVVRLALAEEISPNICVTCGGSGDVVKDRKLITCPACKGTRRKEWTDRNRAELLGFPYTTFMNTWKDRLDVIRTRYINDWEDKIWRAVI